MSCLLYFPRRTTDWEGLIEELFRACAKRKEEKQMGFLSLDDVISSNDRQDKVIASYFKEVKIRELRIWKGNMRSLVGRVSDDGHLLIGDEPRKKNFQELREMSTSMPITSLKSFEKEDSS